jgi:hypothetical protein
MIGETGEAVDGLLSRPSSVLTRRVDRFDQTVRRFPEMVGAVPFDVGKLREQGLRLFGKARR